MSFTQGPDLEAGRPAGNGDFDFVCSQVTDRLYTVTSAINNMRRLLARLDNPNNEARLLKLMDESTDQFKQLGTQVKQVSAWPARSLSATQKFTQTKLAKDFGAVVDEFRRLQREAAAKERAKNVMKRTEANVAALEEPSSDTGILGSPPNHDERTPLLHQPILDTVAQSDVDFRSYLIQEREEDIHTIEQGINEINSIVRDLGTLVTRQGSQLDSVENNVTNLASTVENSAKQLNKAEESQKRRRRWSCFFLTAMVIILMIVIVVVLA